MVWIIRNTEQGPCACTERPDTDAGGIGSVWKCDVCGRRWTIEKADWEGPNFANRIWAVSI